MLRCRLRRVPRKRRTSGHPVPTTMHAAAQLRRGSSDRGAACGARLGYSNEVCRMAGEHARTDGAAFMPIANTERPIPFGAVSTLYVLIHRMHHVWSSHHAPQHERGDAPLRSGLEHATACKWKTYGQRRPAMDVPHCAACDAREPRPCYLVPRTDSLGVVVSVAHPFTPRPAEVPCSEAPWRR